MGRTRVPCLLCAVILLLAAAGIGWAQTTSITITNPGFETLPSSPNWIDCSGNGGPGSGGPGCRDTLDNNIPGWTPSSGAQTGLFQPGPNYFTVPMPAGEGQTAVQVNSGSISQILSTTLKVSTVCTLQVDVGRRMDNLYPSPPPTAQLFAGSTLIASATGTQPPLGGWATWTGTYQSSASDALAGQALKIVLGTTAPQGNFDNVRLTSAPSGATSGALFTYNGFASTAGLSLIGSAATTATADGTVLRLTPATSSQSGAAYSTTPVTLGNNATFSTRFQFRFTNQGGQDPADGITFVVGTSTTGLGGLGVGMGYQGVGGKSVAIEFDTFNNAGYGLGNNDGNSSNHVSIDTNGVLTNTDLTNVYGDASCGFTSGNPAQNSNTVAGCMSNGDLWTANISYDGSLLTVILTDPAEASSFSAINSYAINLASLLGQNTAYVGFTSGTGGGWENHDIVNWTFANTVQSFCTYSLSPGSASPGAAAATGTVTVTAGTGCTWTAASNASWISVTAGASGSGNGTVTYSVGVNTGAARTGTLTIGGQTFTVAQAAGGATSGCSYSVNPTSIHATAAATSSTLLISTNSGCAWTASVPSGVTWITLSPTSGSGAGGVGYAITANTGAARNTTVTVAGVSVTVSQDASASCTYTLSATTSPLISGVGGVGSVAVTVAGTSCAAWKVATPSVSWVHVAGTGSNSSGTVSYSVDSNTTAARRTTTLTVANQSYTVQQDAAPCTYALSPATSGTLAAGGASGSFQVTAAGPACTWSITLPSDANSQWIHVTSALNAMSSGSVSYTVDPNNTTSVRSLALTLNGKNPATTLTYTMSQAAGAANTAPPPIVTPNGIVNAASFISANLPAGSIAQGSFFSIFGNGLGPANPGLSATSFPLGATLGGVSVKVTQGATSVNAIPVFVAQYQINAVMPSNTPAGSVQVTVSYNNLTSAPAAVQVVPANFGAFTVSGGRGPGIVQNYVSATQVPLNMTDLTAAPGDTVILWGTGLGPLPAGASDTQPAPAGSLPASVQVLLGNLTITPAYAGRAPGLAGVDQIDFQLPSNVPLGCYVPLQVVVNGNASNTVTMAINNNRQPCSDSSPFSATSRTGGKNASIGLARLSYTDPTNALKIGNGTVDIAMGSFNQSTGVGDLGFSLYASLPPINTCTYYNNIGSLNGLLGGQLPGAANGATPLDAGPAISVQGPNGLQGVSYSDSSAQVSPYMGVLGTGGGWTALGLGPSTPFLDPGSYTVSGPGGKDVGPFQYTMQIPAGATWTNRDSITAVDRTKGLTVQWSGGTASTQAVAIIGYSSNPATNVSGGFACLSDMAPGTFTVPSNFLANLPATPASNPGNALSALVFVTVPTASQFVNFTTSAPPSLDSGLGYYAVGELRNNVAFQ
ncbi:MAG: BACON domain-containing carbohydrate-binding protein [Candidatus Solibacter sp.]